MYLAIYIWHSKNHLITLGYFYTLFVKQLTQHRKLLILIHRSVIIIEVYVCTTWSHLRLQEHKATTFLWMDRQLWPQEHSASNCNVLLMSVLHLLSTLPILNSCRDRGCGSTTLVGLMSQMSLLPWLENWKTDSSWLTTAS